VTDVLAATAATYPEMVEAWAAVYARRLMRRTRVAASRHELEDTALSGLSSAASKQYTHT